MLPCSRAATGHLGACFAPTHSLAHLVGVSTIYSVVLLTSEKQLAAVAEGQMVVSGWGF